VTALQIDYARGMRTLAGTAALVTFALCACFAANATAYSRLQRARDGAGAAMYQAIERQTGVEPRTASVTGCRHSSSASYRCRVRSRQGENVEWFGSARVQLTTCSVRYDLSLTRTSPAATDPAVAHYVLRGSVTDVASCTNAGRPGSTGDSIDVAARNRAAYGSRRALPIRNVEVHRRARAQIRVHRSARYRYTLPSSGTR